MTIGLMVEKRSVLIYGSRKLWKKDFLVFLELSPFTSLCKYYKLTDDDLHRIQLEIMCDPKAHSVVKGTGGFRKMRYSPISLEGGKSGGMRVWYNHFEQFRMVVLGVIYRKSEREDLSAEEKERIRKATEIVEKVLAKRIKKNG